jgi:sterol desaturase/sphingolipid hydroxylase (fatty acid hydroxylase superfamily)
LTVWDRIGGTYRDPTKESERSGAPSLGLAVAGRR